jgi:hypothetical protein
MTELVSAIGDLTLQANAVVLVDPVDRLSDLAIVDFIMVVTLDDFKYRVTRQYLGSRWTLLSDIMGSHVRDLEPVKIPFTNVELLAFLDLNEQMDFSKKIRNTTKPIYHSTVNGIARFFSPIDSHWEMFCLKIADSYEQCIKLGKRLRSRTMPPWFQYNHTFHNNFNLRYDPIYMESDPTLRKKYLKIGWLNLATYLIWNAWVKSSYSDHVELHHIDWSATMLSESFLGDNWRILKYDVTYEDLLNPNIGLHSETMLLTGSKSIYNGVATAGNFGYLTENEKQFLLNRLLNYDFATFDPRNFLQLILDYGLFYLTHKRIVVNYDRFSSEPDSFNRRIYSYQSRFSYLIRNHYIEKNSHILRYDTYPSHSIKTIVKNIVKESRLLGQLLLEISACMDSSYGNKAHKFYQCMYDALN